MKEWHRDGSNRTIMLRMGTTTISMAKTVKILSLLTLGRINVESDKRISSSDDDGCLQVRTCVLPKAWLLGGYPLYPGTENTHAQLTLSKRALPVHLCGTTPVYLTEKVELPFADLTFRPRRCFLQQPPADPQALLG